MPPQCSVFTYFITMFRQLIGLVLLSLAAFGIAPAQADQAYLLQGPPKVEVYEVKVTFDGNRADNLQPTLSSSTERTFYTVRTDVLTNGPIDNIDVVAVCLYSEANIGADLGADDACGYATDATDRAGMIDPPETYNPAHSISMAWTTGDGFRLDNEANVQHSVDTERSRAQATTQVDRTVAGETVSYTSKRLDFVFALSHAAVNASDWRIRVVAVSTPTPKSVGDPVSSEATREIYSGSCSNQYSDTNQITDDGTRNPSCQTPEEHGVNFFGGFMESTVRDSLDYGSIQENSSSGLKVELATADYFANDTVNMSISASDFTYSGDTIPLITEDAAVTGTKQLKMECTGETDVDSGSASTNDVIVGQNALDFFTGMNASSAGTASESELPVSAPTHSCELSYGTGATYGNEVYKNTVTLGLYDGDTATGPNAVGVYTSVETDGDSNDTFTEATTDDAVRP